MRIRKMNAATGTHLLVKYGLKGVAYTSDGNPDRYICGCGNVSNTAHCEVCGNETYKHILGTWSTYGGFQYLAVYPKVCTHKDDPVIAPNTIVEKNLGIKADVKANRFIIDESYTMFLEVVDKGIRFGTNNNGASFDQILEEHKEDVMTEEQMAFYEGAKVLYDTWGINENTRYQRLLIISYYMRLLKLIADGTITIPEADIYEYRALMLRAMKDCTREVHFGSINDVLRAINFPICFKEYYKFDISGNQLLDMSTSYGFNNDILDSISILVQNSFLFALMHGQLTLAELTGMLRNLQDTPESVQEEFVDFFGKHVSIFKDSTLNQFFILKEAAKQFPAQPAKFDIKSVSTLETLRYMKSRGINDTRAEMVMEALEKDPMVAIQLLHEKKKVTPEEHELFNALK